MAVSIGADWEGEGRTWRPCMTLISSLSTSFTSRCCLIVESPLNEG